jgi:hemerythrin superfamily protein
MPEATEILMQDHRKVETLFTQYEQSRDPSIAEQICTELTVHSATEEKVVYPVLGRDVQGGQRMRSHSEDEHKQVKDLILEIQKVGPSNSAATELMARLKAAVVEHVEEEEQEVFPKMREDLGQDRLTKLGQEVSETKQKLMAEAETGGPLIDLTKEELYELAKERGIEGRSDMTKEQLIGALRQA